MAHQDRNISATPSRRKALLGLVRAFPSLDLLLVLRTPGLSAGGSGVSVA